MRGGLADAYFRQGTEHDTLHQLTRLVDEGDLAPETGSPGSPEWEEARRYLETSRQQARTLRIPDAERGALAHLAVLDLLEGRPEEATARLEPMLTGTLGWAYGVVLLSTLAAAYLELGDSGRARPMAQRAIAEARHLENWTHGVGALRVRGMVEAHLGNDDAAVSAYEEGLRRARAIPFPHGEAQLLEVYGVLDHQRGDTGSAHAKFSDARSMYERLGATRDAQRLGDITAAVDLRTNASGR